MKHLLRIFTVVLGVLVVMSGRETAVATQQTLSGQDAVSFLQEAGIYEQLAAEASSGFSPEGREFFSTGKIGASDGNTDDLFGISVARDDDTVLIGVYQADIDGVVDQGAAYVYTPSGSNGWSRQAKLTADDGAANDRFGFAVALDGNTALVGAPRADIDGLADQGAVYAFSRSGTVWDQVDKLTLGNIGSSGDEFGSAVGLDGTAALIGAPLYDFDDTDTFDQGAAYIFTQSGNSWNQTAVLNAQYVGTGNEFGSAVALDGTSGTRPEGIIIPIPGSEFGSAVALDGNRALVGAPFEDIGFDENQGAAYVFTGSGTNWSQEARLATGDGIEDDRFGGAVALDGDTALVGAHLANVNGNNNQGAAYVFTREGSEWYQQDKLTANDGAPGDRLGRSVAVEGDTALLGAPRADIEGNSNQGAAYVFIREGDSWSQQNKLTDWSDGEAGDRFGRSVALAGDTALVGAIYGELSFGNADRGAVYPFARSEVPWLPYGEAVADDGNEDDEFGYAVALNEDRALVGAPFIEVDGNESQGAAYIFERSDTSWVQIAKLTAADGLSFERFGYAVTMDDGIALIGAPGKDSAADAGGAAYVFIEESDSSWVQYEKLTAPIRRQRDEFGISVALDGDTVLIGMPGEDIDDNAAQGAAFVFIRESSSSWSQQAKLTAVDGVEFDEFGRSVALDGDTALVGAHLADVDGNDSQGAAYVFTREGGSWSHQAKLFALDGAVSDWFGREVALDGNTALVGACFADVNGNSNQGAVYFFTRTGNSWNQQAKLTATDGARDDRFGNAIALEGNTALVGAPGDPDFTDIQGAAYIFAWDGSSWQQQTKLTAVDGAEDDLFGDSVALGGTIALVGASGVDVNGNDNEGKVYFFQRQPYELFLPMIVR